MKTLITYYSYSGNTDRVAQAVAGILRARGEVTLQRLVPQDEVTSFVAQCQAAFWHKRASLRDPVIADASPYELVIIASPVWAFAPVPTINTYLDMLSGLNGKKVIVILTSGSGAGVKRCFTAIRTVLASKGAAEIREINIKDRKSHDGELIASSLAAAL